MNRYDDPLLRLELDEQVEDRGLHGDVECGGRLVAHDELGIARESARDRDALLETARQLHGLLREGSLRQAYPRKICMPPLGRRRRHTRELAQRAEQDPAHRVASVECGIRVLEDDLKRPQARGERFVKLGQHAAVQLAVPLVGSTIPSSARASVVFPLPDSPTSPSVSPGQTLRDAGERMHLVSLLLEDLARSLNRRAALRAVDAGQVDVPASGAEARGRGRGTSTGSRARSPTGISGGSSARQRSSASAQRSANTQPGSSAPRREEARDSVQSAMVLAHATARDAAEQPDGVRVARILEDRLDRPSSTRRPA